MLKLENICKKFGDKTVLDGFCASFSPGIHALCGKSGAGKTTLLRIIAGLENAEFGSVTGQGKISFVFQEARLLPWYTAGRNVALVSDSGKAAELLSALGLRDEYGTYPTELSGGMQKRVSLARALAADFDTLLLDEPFSGLDSANAAGALSAIKKYAAKKTVLLVTHDLKLAESLNSVTIIGA